MKLQSIEAIQSLAVVGATGIVGREFLDLLDESKIRLRKLKLLASDRSEGEEVQVGDQTLVVERLQAGSFEGVEAVFFSVPSSVTEEFAPLAVRSGSLVVDDSALYRMSIHVPLVVPEVNGHVLKNFQGKVIAIPNCSTTPLALCLKPLHEKYGLHRVIVSTYQSVSGAGRQATEELSEQAAALLNGRSTEPQVFPHRIAFNCIPEIGETTESGYTEEEEKVSRELRKILDIPNLPVSATAVRVPTFCGHGLSVNVELCKGYDSLEEVRQLLDSMPGLKVKDKVEHHIYPTNVEATGTDQVLVGRIRRDRSVTYGLNLWIVVDNLRKGAALNALQCLETLYRYRRMI